MVVHDRAPLRGWRPPTASVLARRDKEVRRKIERISKDFAIRLETAFRFRYGRGVAEIIESETEAPVKEERLSERVRRALLGAPKDPSDTSHLHKMSLV